MAAYRCSTRRAPPAPCGRPSSALAILAAAVVALSAFGAWAFTRSDGAAREAAAASTFFSALAASVDAAAVSTPLAVGDVAFLRASLGRLCGESAMAAVFPSRDLRAPPPALAIFRAAVTACAAESFVPFAAREVWPAASDAVILSDHGAGGAAAMNDSSAALASAADAILLRGCATRVDASRACIIFIHQEALLSAAPRVIALLRADTGLRVVLLTSSNRDFCVPWGQVNEDGSWTPRVALDQLLRHPRTLAWFTENPCGSHDKLRALPLGPKLRWNWDVTFSAEDVRPAKYRLLALAAAAAAPSTLPRAPSLLIAMSAATSDSAAIGTQCGIRAAAMPHMKMLERELAPPKGLGDTGDGSTSLDDSRVGFTAYARTLLKSTLVWAPPGCGADSHRAYEALLAGATPIVLAGPLTRARGGAYGRLRVVTTSNFSAVDAPTLISAARAAAAAGPQLVDAFSPLYVFYWLREIDAAARLLPSETDDAAPFVIGLGEGYACAARAQPWEAWPQAAPQHDWLTVFACLCAVVAGAVALRSRRIKAAWQHLCASSAGRLSA